MYTNISKAWDSEKELSEEQLKQLYLFQTVGQVDFSEFEANFLVKNGLPNKFSPTRETKELFLELESLGKLSPDFNGEVLLPLLNHVESDIRLLAVKNIAKLSNKKFLTSLIELANKENNTLVRRETISAIGRMRTSEAVPALLGFLKDSDAKVVLQVIRALLYFKEDEEVLAALKNLAKHPNEQIQAVISQSLAKSKGSAKQKDNSHTTFPAYLKNTVVNADVLETLKLVPDNSVHLTVTSPPYYNARDYQIYQSYEEYLQFLTEIFKEIHRVTKEGRFFALNTSPVIEPRMSRAHSSKRYLIPFDIHPRLTAVGWEFIEDIIWMKPAPSAKNRNGGFFQHRKPLAYKANSIAEYVIIYRKKTDKLIDWNLDQYPTETIEESKVKGDYEKTNVWQIAPANDKVHPAIFPKDLVGRLIQFYSMQGDLIFDPFGGIGTVGQSAIANKRHFFLTEKEHEYTERAKQILGDNLTVMTLQEFKEGLKK